MSASSLEPPPSLAAIATSMQGRERPKQAVYVGIEMRSEAHNYQKLHYILMHFRAEKVSARIWMILVDPSEEALITSLINKFVADGDRVIVAKAPAAQGLIAA